MATDYETFVRRKSQIDTDAGFAPLWMPAFLFDFQQALVEWATVKGRCAIFADCGLGKTPMQLVWAQNVVEKTNRPVLILTPLAVSAQTVREGEKFGIECHRSRDGKPGGKGITVTNYEQIDKFDRNDFAGIVLDESSAIKHFSGARQKSVTAFMSHTPYRLLCTATAAPNDYIELGTSAEALGQLGRMDMLGTYFHNDEHSLHPIWWGARWRFKKHAETLFWRWVCSWARAVRRPSDLGFADARFVLPQLRSTETTVKNAQRFTGELFVRQAVSLAEQREERRLTMAERCAEVARRVTGRAESLVWCHMNEEGDTLARMIPGSRNVQGSDTDEEKEEAFLDFAAGRLKVLITKPKIGSFGLNFQNCAHMTFFPSHSFEQFYQGVRRCWRFGQTRPVDVDIITTEGEMGVLLNMQRKAAAAEVMFDQLVREMHQGLAVARKSDATTKAEAPSWL
jgi:hypothetical protein